MKAKLIITVVAALALAQAASAHHSAIAFDLNGQVTITGDVLLLNWRNPHIAINMEVVNDQGETELWKLESAGISNLIRNGWTKDVIGPGNTITATVRPMRNGKPGGLLMWVTLDNGTVLAVNTENVPDNYAPPKEVEQRTFDAEVDVAPVGDDAYPTDLSTILAANDADFEARKKAWMERERLSRPKLPLLNEAAGPGALDPDNLSKSRPKAPFDMTGVWQIRSDREFAKRMNANVWDFPPLPKLTPDAAASHNEYLEGLKTGVRVADTTAYCYPPGMPRVQTRAGAFMAIQMPTAIYIVHRFNNDFRTIYLDGRDHVDSSIRIDSYNGDATGQWLSDGTLLVDVVGFGQSEHYIQRGIPVSEEFHFTERYFMLNDGNTLAVEWTFVDPVNWEGEWIHTKIWDRMLHKDIEEANCTPADNAALPGLD